MFFAFANEPVDCEVAPTIHSSAILFQTCYFCVLGYCRRLATDMLRAAPLALDWRSAQVWAGAPHRVAGHFCHLAELMMCHSQEKLVE